MSFFRSSSGGNARNSRPFRVITQSHDSPCLCETPDKPHLARATAGDSKQLPAIRIVAGQELQGNSSPVAASILG